MSGMYNFTRDDYDLEAIRKRLAKMSDEALLRYGKAGAFMVSRSKRETFRVQLEETRAEWRRRHGSGPPKPAP